MKSLWLIIWRFQPLHNGHKLLIETSLKENTTTLVLVGSINKSGNENPYNYELRESIIKDEFPDESLTIWPLPDLPSDTEWLAWIMKYIPKDSSKVVLYCGDIKNDSAAISLEKLKDTLPFSLEIQEIPRSIIPISATQIREWICENNLEKLEEYISKKTLKKLLK